MVRAAAPPRAPPARPGPDGALHARLSRPQEPSRVQIFFQQCVVIADPALMKRVLQTNIKNYVKDIEFAYKPFMARSLTIFSAFPTAACPPALHDRQPGRRLRP